MNDWHEHQGDPIVVVSQYSIRRELSGKPFFVTPLYWRCGCTVFSIQYNLVDECPACGRKRVAAPHAETEEVILYLKLQFLHLYDEQIAAIGAKP